MTTRTYPLRAGQAFSALIFATACGLVGCGDDGDPNSQSPYGNGYTSPEASTVVVGGNDAGTTPTPVVTSTPDAGTPVIQQPLDSGTKPVVTADTGVPVVTVDSGIAVVPEGGVAPDAGGGAPRADQGMGDGKDVICIGDSWMHLMGTSGIQDSLVRISKRPFRVFGVPGTELLMSNLSGPAIPTQYDDAKKGGPVKTVVMTGGGNDILQEKLLPCIDANFDNDKVCPTQIDAVAAKLTQFWAQMAKDGVTDVVIVGYSAKTNPGGLGTTKKSIAYSNMKIPPLCDMVPAPLRCSTFDTDMMVPDLVIRSDGIHPDDASYDKIGTALWKFIQDKGMRR